MGCLGLEAEQGERKIRNNFADGLTYVHALVRCISEKFTLPLLEFVFSLRLQPNFTSILSLSYFNNVY